MAGAIIENFQERFNSSDDIRTHIEGLKAAALPASEAARAAATEVQNAAHLGTSQIAKETQRINELHLLSMFNAVANAGLNQWAPDVLGTVESMYNALHEEIAVSTFKNVAASFGYSFMNVDLSFLTNHTFLVKLYRSFVFGYMAQIARRESKSPGRIAKE